MTDELFPEHRLFHRLCRRPIGQIFAFVYSEADRRDITEQLEAAGVTQERADAVLKQLNSYATFYAYLAARKEMEHSPKEVRDALSRLGEDLRGISEHLEGLSLEAKVELEHAYAEEEPASVFEDFYNEFVGSVTKLQSIADQAYLESTSRVPHHRPRDNARHRFVYWLAGIWHKETGKVPTSTIAGPFWSFARATCRPHFDATDDLVKDTARHYRDHHDADAEVHRLTGRIIRRRENQGENPS